MIFKRIHSGINILTSINIFALLIPTKENGRLKRRVVDGSCSPSDDKKHCSLSETHVQIPACQISIAIFERNSTYRMMNDLNLFNVMS